MSWKYNYLLSSKWKIWKKVGGYWVWKLKETGWRRDWAWLRKLTCRRCFRSFWLVMKLSVSSLLAPHFKLSARMSPKTVNDCEYMAHVPYASAVGNLMYAMVCTRPNLSQAVSMVCRYMYDPGRVIGRLWDALWYIKGTVDVELVFEMDVGGKQEYTGYANSDYARILTSAGPLQGISLPCRRHRWVGVVLYSLQWLYRWQKQSTWLWQRL